MKDECLICGAPLKYLNENIEMECSICHKKEHSNTMCEKGHYVCDSCHTQGLDEVVAICLSERSKNPCDILEKLMSMPFCHMHGPEHHILVGASLLTAYKNAGGDLDLPSALELMISRGKEIPGGACGFWGACGAGISSGIFVSIITGSTPLKVQEWGLSNMMTSAALSSIGKIGGPRCCKRNSYIAITEAVEFVKKHLNISMELQKISCTRSENNNQCIKNRCPFGIGAVSNE